MTDKDPDAIHQKIPSRAENKTIKEGLSLNCDDYSPVYSPMVDRPKLSWHTESELRAACGAIVKAEGGSGSAKDSKTRDSNLANISKVLREKSSGYLNQVHPRSKEPNGRMSTKSDPHHASMPKERPEASLKEMLAGAYDMKVQTGDWKGRDAQPSSFKPRSDSLALGGSQRIRALSRPMQPSESQAAHWNERPKTAPVDSSNASCATPLTSSTDRQAQNSSTAMTSAALTPSRPSKHGSQQFVLDTEAYQAAVFKADAQAAEWIKRARKISQDGIAPQSAPRRISNPGKPIAPEAVNGLALAKTHNRDSNQSSESGLPLRGSSAQGWRNWSLVRKSSKSSLTDDASETSRSRQSGELERRKKELDLNRELPPLPSLDTYKDPNDDNTHIASMMRAESQVVARLASKFSNQNLESQSPNTQIHRARAVSVRTESSDILYSPPRKFSDAHSKSSSQDSCFSPASSTAQERSIDLLHAANLARSSESLQQARVVHMHKGSKKTSMDLPTSAVQARPTYSIMPASRTFATHHRAPSQPVLPTIKQGSSTTSVNLPPRPATRGGVPSKSRVGGWPHQPTPTPLKNSSNDDNNSNSIKPAKMTTDELSRPAEKQKSQSPVVPGEITALPPMPVKKQRGLRRVFSAMSFRKDNVKPDYLVWDQSEKDIIQTGVLAEGGGGGGGRGIKV